MLSAVIAASFLFATSGTAADDASHAATGPLLLDAKTTIGDEPAATIPPADAAKVDANAASAPKPSWPKLADPDAFRIELAPRAWYTSPSGKFKLPSSTTAGNSVRVEDLNLDEPRVSPYGEVIFRIGDFRLNFSGAEYSADRGGTAPSAFRIGDVTVNAGDQTQSKFEFTTFTISGGYRFYEHDFGKAGGGAPDRTVVRVDAEAGVRIYDLKIEVSSGAATSRTQQTFTDLFAGARVDLQIARDFSLDVLVNGGGYFDSDRSVTSLDGSIAFTWRPVDGVGIQLGWRQLLYHFKDGKDASEFDYRGGMAGLFTGVVIRF